MQKFNDAKQGLKESRLKVKNFQIKIVGLIEFQNTKIKF